MSYALGIKTKHGLVFAADSRTNAGPDQMSSFRKLHVFERPGERFMAIAAVGNLSLAQSLLTALRANGGESKSRGQPLLEAPDMMSAATLVGQALRALETREGPSLSRHNVPFDVTVILGGQVAGEPPRLFLLYPAGNFIEAPEDAPFFQIGERKYGKPVLDLTITAHATLSVAVKAALLSCDATVQNNATVGMPVDLLALPAGQFSPSLLRRYAPEDPFFAQLRRKWREGVNDLITSLPDVPNVAARNLRDFAG
jgi:putative proteasome-type protease